jgi:hypothetical protein
VCDSNRQIHCPQFGKTLETALSASPQTAAAQLRQPGTNAGTAKLAGQAALQSLGSKHTLTKTSAANFNAEQ